MSFLNKSLSFLLVVISIAYANNANADISISPKNKIEIPDTWFFTTPRNYDLSEEEAILLAKKAVPKNEDYEFRTMYYLRTVYSEDSIINDTAYWSIAANPPGNRFEGYYFNIYSPDGSTNFDQIDSWISCVFPEFRPNITSQRACQLLLDYLIEQQPFILPIMLEKTYPNFISWTDYQIERETSLSKLEIYLQCHIYTIKQNNTAEITNAILLNPYKDIRFFLYVTPDNNKSMWEFSIAGYEDYSYDAANEVTLPIYNVSKLPWGIDWNSGVLISLLE